MSKSKDSRPSAPPNQDKANRDHHANQLNPNSAAHKAGQDNRANQLNSNNPAYHSSRGDTGKKP